MSETPEIQAEAERLAAKVLQHVTDALYPNNTWFTNVTPIIATALLEARQAGRQEIFDLLYPALDQYQKATTEAGKALTLAKPPSQGEP